MPGQSTGRGFGGGFGGRTVGEPGRRIGFTQKATPFDRNFTLRGISAQRQSFRETWNPTPPTVQSFQETWTS